MAFPGGRRQAEDADDLATAVRETREEVGLDLATSDFRLLGRLPERPVTARGKLVPGMVICPFVFAQEAEQTPALRLEPSEVSACCWAHEGVLKAAHVRYSVARPYSPLPPALASALPPATLRGLGIDAVSFPAIMLRETPPDSSGGSAASPHGPQPDGPFELWGITLAVTADMLARAGEPPLFTVPVRPHNALLRAAASLLLRPGLVEPDTPGGTRAAGGAAAGVAALVALAGLGAATLGLRSRM